MLSMRKNIEYRKSDAHLYTNIVLPFAEESVEDYLRC